VVEAAVTMMKMSTLERMVLILTLTSLVTQVTIKINMMKKCPLKEVAPLLKKYVGAVATTVEAAAGVVVANSGATDVAERGVAATETVVAMRSAVPEARAVDLPDRTLANMRMK